MKVLFMVIFYAVMALLCAGNYLNIRTLSELQVEKIVASQGEEAIFWLGSDVEDDYVALWYSLYAEERNRGRGLFADPDPEGKPDVNGVTATGPFNRQYEELLSQEEALASGEAEDGAKGLKAREGFRCSRELKRDTLLDARLFLPLRTHGPGMLAIFVACCALVYCVKLHRVREHVNPLNVKLIAVNVAFMLPPVIVYLALLPSAGVSFMTIFILLHAWIIAAAYGFVYSFIGWSR